MESNIVEILRQHGPMTWREIQKWTERYSMSELCTLKRKGFIYQPRKGLWAAVPEEQRAKRQGDIDARLLLEHYQRLQAQGYDVSEEITRYKARLAGVKDQAA
jgi:hypothetical protein